MQQWKYCSASNYISWIADVNKNEMSIPYIHSMFIWTNTSPVIYEQTSCDIYNSTSNSNGLAAPRCTTLCCIYPSSLWSYSAHGTMASPGLQLSLWDHQSSSKVQITGFGTNWQGEYHSCWTSILIYILCVWSIIPSCVSEQCNVLTCAIEFSQWPVSSDYR